MSLRLLIPASLLCRSVRSGDTDVCAFLVQSLAICVLMLIFYEFENLPLFYTVFAFSVFVTCNENRFAPRGLLSNFSI